MTVIPTVLGVLGMVPKGLEKRLEELEFRGKLETIQTTTLLRLTRIPRRVLEKYHHEKVGGKLARSEINYIHVYKYIHLLKHIKYKLK